MTIAFARMVGAFDANRLSLYQSIVRPAWEREGVFAHEIRDETRAGCWPTAKRAWEHLQASPDSHVCVLQDDFTPCRGFLRALEAFVERSPEGTPLSLFQPAAHESEIGKVRKLMVGGRDFEVPRGWVAWGGCLVLPVALVKPVLAIGSVLDGLGDADDRRLSAALRVLGRSIVNCSPSLVRHDGARWESLVGEARNDEEWVRYREGATRIS